jgi:hypothetical protein
MPASAGSLPLLAVPSQSENRGCAASYGHIACDDRRHGRIECGYPCQKEKLPALTEKNDAQRLEGDITFRTQLFFTIYPLASIEDALAMSGSQRRYSTLLGLIECLLIWRLPISMVGQSMPASFSLFFRNAPGSQSAQLLASLLDGQFSPFV